MQREHRWWSWMFKNNNMGIYWQIYKSTNLHNQTLTKGVNLRAGNCLHLIKCFSLITLVLEHRYTHYTQCVHTIQCAQHKAIQFQEKLCCICFRELPVWEIQICSLQSFEHIPTASHAVPLTIWEIPFHLIQTSKRDVRGRVSDC